MAIPSAIIWAFLGGLVPALFWLFFWLKEDKIHPEPKGVIALAFVAGMGSVLLALPLELMFAHYVPEGVLRILLWAASEELVKYWAASYSAFHHNRNFDEPVDAMIYLISSALGFAAAENAFFIFGALQGFPITVTIISGGMRFIGATLLHVLASATIGACMAFSFYRNSFVKEWHLVLGVVLAILLHTLFNFLILMLEAQGLQAYTLGVFVLVWIGILVLLFYFEKVKAVIK
ncbi:MAG: hypothetical protein A2542_02040 [Parcubacteria group bacterium RIFOXYD2_FULL_52_8]|nr:MAG: hypothetical protein A2542_02040 [Parcubacteria group bacterium RIFOXYD2_FULL_52_8]